MSTADSGISLKIDLQVAADAAAVPDDADWKAWVRAALCGGGYSKNGVVTVRLVTEVESATLNLSFRDQPGATNVLAFPGPGDEPAFVHSEAAGATACEAELGDIVVCLPVACREADQQGKRRVAHLAHLVVHGTLHLIGYDHDNEIDAKRMESIETGVLCGLGFTDPYIFPASDRDPMNGDDDER